jgi:hypothetical protein
MVLPGGLGSILPMPEEKGSSEHIPIGMFVLVLCSD